MLGGTRRPVRRPARPYVVVAVILGLGAAGVFVVRGLSAYSTPSPEFPSLADAPDPSLEGTVAYTETGGPCVHVVAAAGSPSREVLCFEGNEGEGPQLAFLADGRLEVTMFDWPPEQPIRGAWQKIVDIKTGAVDETPAAEVPDTPFPAAEPPLGPNGERIVATSEGGRITIVVDGPSGSETLLSAEGNPDYRLVGPPVWSPDGQWVLAQEADEGRLLLITVGDPPQTRVLVEHPASFASSGIVGFAVWGADLLETPAAASSTTATLEASATTPSEVWSVAAPGDSFVAGVGTGGPRHGIAGASAEMPGEQLGVVTALHSCFDYETVSDWSETGLRPDSSPELRPIPL